MAKLKDAPVDRTYWEATIRIPHIGGEPDHVTIHGSASSHHVAAQRAAEARRVLHDALNPRQADGDRDAAADEQPADA